jgi:hypothetical protein
MIMEERCYQGRRIPWLPRFSYENIPKTALLASSCGSFIVVGNIPGLRLSYNISIFFVKRPGADVEALTYCATLTMKMKRKVISFFIFPSNGAPVE